MSASLLTISKRRIQEILQEEVTVGNVKHAVTSELADNVSPGGVSARIADEYRVPMENVPGDPKMGTTWEKYATIEFTALLRPGTAVDRAEELARSLEAKLEMQPKQSTSKEPGVGEFSVDGTFAVSEEDVATTGGIEKRVKIIGRLKDGFPDVAQPAGSADGPSKPLTPGLAADMDTARTPSTPGQWRGGAAKVVEKTIAMTRWLPRKALTTVMERLEDEEATGAEWWKGMLDDLVKVQAKEAEEDPDVPDIPSPIDQKEWAEFLDGTFNFAKEAIGFVSANNAKTTVAIPRDQALKDDIQAAYKNNDTLFGFKVDDTVVSPPVSESLDPIRRIVRQIINESHLSKDA